MRLLHAAWLASLVGLVIGTPAPAQFTDPAASWRTIETPHFVVHYPADAAEWTLPVAERLESVRSAVGELVGHAPRERVTVVVTDPMNLSNGMAIPFLDAPTLVLWPTPPEPRLDIGEHRGWGELLAVHEFGHLAHLTRPSRNPWQRLVWRLLPVRMGPIARRAPRWLAEGYATYLEGRLTGSGRPHGVWRPTILRQWALEGKLPEYTELDDAGGYRAGSMAYLAGSAFLEWLVQQKGEESLQHLWRRMSARQSRSFSEAFAGVYGGTPDDLYARFTVELTGRSLQVERALEDAGLVQGETVQRLEWETGDPALSPDGQRLALVLREGSRPSRLVVWSTDEEPADSAALRARRRALERDPEDVPAIQWRPRPKKPLAVLYPSAGRAHHSPRFLPDGERILVVRQEPLPDGQSRPDLFLWDYRRGSLRRVTHGAGIRAADPTPGGRRAVGTRCLYGSCDLVEIDLASGAVRQIHAGSPGRVFYRPRVSPDGREIAVAVQEDGRWRVALTDPDGAPLRFVDPGDGADRYDVDFLPGQRALVAVSHRGGIPNLERLDLDSDAVQPLTRVTGAALAPAPHPADGSIFFLRLHSEGLDLARLHPDTAALPWRVALAPGLAPAVPSPAGVRPAPLAVVEPSAPRPYGLGPRSWLPLVNGTAAAGADALHLVLGNTDPVGRLGVLLQGSLGEPGAWNGASLAVAWRGSRPALLGEAFAARQSPSKSALDVPGLEALDADYAGGALAAELARVAGGGEHRFRLGGSAGSLRGGDAVGRHLGLVEYAGQMLQTPGALRLTQALHLQAAAGATGGEGWTRLRGSAAVGARVPGFGVRAEASHVRVSSGAHPFERPVIGGAQPLLLDPSLLSQRIAMPAIHLGTLSGEELSWLRLDGALLGLSPYFWAATTGAASGSWYRVVGLEESTVTAPMPLLRLPAVHVTAGVGYPLDEPYRHRLRFYGTVGFRP